MAKWQDYLFKATSLTLGVATIGSVAWFTALGGSIVSKETQVCRYIYHYMYIVVMDLLKARLVQNKRKQQHIQEVGKAT
jgi:hypothetical protein